MKNALTLTGLVTALSMLMCLAQPAAGNEALLAGTVKSPPAEPLGGATVTAKADGATIAAPVFTAKAANYSLPPMPPGKYRVWAQALAYEAARGDVDLARSRHHDFTLAPIKD